MDDTIEFVKVRNLQDGVESEVLLGEFHAFWKDGASIGSDPRCTIFLTGLAPVAFRVVAASNHKALFRLPEGTPLPLPAPGTPHIGIFEKRVDYSPFTVGPYEVQFGSISFFFSSSSLIEPWKEETRLFAKRSLRRAGIGPRAAIPALLINLTDESARTRSLAMDTLALLQFSISSEQLQPEELPEMLERLLDDADGDVRSQAAACLGRLGTAAADALPKLRATLNDAAQDARVDAAIAIWKIAADKETATPALVRELRAIVAASSSQGMSNIELFAVSRRSAECLSEMDAGAAELMPLLVAALDKRIGVTIRDAIVRVGPAAVPALVGHLNADNPYLRSAVLNILGRMSLPAIKPTARPLRLRLGVEKSGPLRWHIRSLLDRIEDGGFRYRLRRIWRALKPFIK